MCHFLPVLVCMSHFSPVSSFNLAQFGPNYPQFWSSSITEKCTTDHLLSWLGTVPILRQQMDWVGGVRKVAISADVQYYLYWRRVGGWVRKIPKMCWRNIGMVPNSAQYALQTAAAAHTTQRVTLILKGFQQF